MLRVLGLSEAVQRALMAILRCTLLGLVRCAECGKVAGVELSASLRAADRACYSRLSA